MRRIILKLSGEALSSSDKTICVEKVNTVAKEIKALYDLGDISIGIICGAGNIWRGRDAMQNGMDRTNADYMGMLGTILNCVALQSSLEKLGLPTRVLTSLSPNCKESGSAPIPKLSNTIRNTLFILYLKRNSCF